MLVRSRRIVHGDLSGVRQLVEFRFYPRTSSIVRLVESLDHQERTGAPL